MCDDDRWNEAASSSHEVDDPVQRSSKVWRQVLRVLQICHGCSTIETQWQCDDSDDQVGIERQIWNRYQKQPRNDVRWNGNKNNKRDLRLAKTLVANVWFKKSAAICGLDLNLISR